MKYLGLFSGKIYEESETSSMEECGHQISDKDASNDEFIRDMHVRDLMSCITCFGCPMARRQNTTTI